MSKKKLVEAVHFADHKVFTYKTEKDVKKGDFLLVKRDHAHRAEAWPVMAISDSFEVSPEAEKALLRANGISSFWSNVVGTYVLREEDNAEKNEDECGDEFSCYCGGTLDVDRPKVFISQPMKGKTEEEISSVRFEIVSEVVTPEVAARQLSNWIKRMRREYKKAGKEFYWVAVTGI